jgi:hypothetical protein
MEQAEMYSGTSILLVLCLIVTRSSMYLEYQNHGLFQGTGPLSVYSEAGARALIPHLCKHIFDILSFDTSHTKRLSRVTSQAIPVSKVTACMHHLHITSSIP